jgi:hypothetical protein
MEFSQKVKLARHLQYPFASRPDDPVTHQGVSTMSIAKIQNAAIALIGAFVVASLFVGAAIPVSPIA